MSSDPIEVLRDALARAMRAGYRSGHHDTVEGRYTDVMHGDHMDYFADEADELLADPDFAALASLSAPKPPSMNDNAVAVNESAPVNDKPESVEAVFNCPTCPVSVQSRWQEPECPECGERCYLDPTAVPAPPLQEASDPIRLRVIFPDGLVQFAPADTRPGYFEGLGCTVLPIHSEDHLAAELKANELRYAAPQQASAPVGMEGFDKRFAEMLLGILNDVQDELGFTDEDKLCANGSAEIVAEIRELKRVAALAQQPAAVDGATRRDAERYRYLRRPEAWKENHISERGASAIFIGDGRRGEAKDGEALDAAIDRILAGQQQGGES